MGGTEVHSLGVGQKGRPSLTITVPKVDARSVGALVYLLEMATAVAGELYDIDAFDQPGVELSKKATYALMGRAGYAASEGRDRVAGHAGFAHAAESG